MKMSQGHFMFFMVRKCAQSLQRIKLPLKHKELTNFEEFVKNSNFRFITLNQDLGLIFMLRYARNRFNASNYPKTPKIYKFFKNFNFRFITHKVYPKSGFGTHFHSSKMCAIDVFPKIFKKNIRRDQCDF